MIVGFWGHYESIIRNGRIFHDPNLGAQENATIKYNKLYEYALLHNVELITLDKIDLKDVDCILLSDIPKKSILNKIISTNKRVFLIQEECAVVTGKDANDIDFSIYDKVFTWSDDLVLRSDKFIKINAYSYIEPMLDINKLNKINFLTLIASNKKSTCKDELYSERLSVIKWYECNHPNLFDLYGHSWDEYVFPLNHNFVGFLNTKKIRIIKKLFATFRPSWRGTVESKKNTLSKYKFSLAFDNAKGINGYILEKIFDVFSAGTVPIYYGAPNIGDHIPKNCFIDYSEFDSIEELHNFLISMNDDQYYSYLYAIEKFLNSPESYQFTNDYFSKTIVSQIQH